MLLSRKQEYYIYIAISIVLTILLIVLLTTDYNCRTIGGILIFVHIIIAFDYKSKYGIFPAKDASILGYNMAGQTVADYSK